MSTPLTMQQALARLRHRHRKHGQISPHGVRQLTAQKRKNKRQKTPLNMKTILLLLCGALFLTSGMASANDKVDVIMPGGTPVNRSGTITTGGSSQTMAPANPARVYLEIQNISDETMYINFGAAATADSNSFKIVAGGSYINPPNYCPRSSVTIISATTGKKFIAKEG